MTEVTITKAEQDALYFIPPAFGGKTPPEDVQVLLQAKGLISAPQADGRRHKTVLGDKVARNSSTVVIHVQG